jgi:hypothetical protein
MIKDLIQHIFSIVNRTIKLNKTKNRIFHLAMNGSLSSLERLLHLYTMEPPTKPFDVRFVHIEVVPVEQPKG